MQVDSEAVESAAHFIVEATRLIQGSGYWNSDDDMYRVSTTCPSAALELSIASVHDLR